MILLEPFEQKDFDHLIHWIDSEESLVQFAGPIFKYPLDYQQLTAYKLDGQRKAFRVKIAETKIVIGHAELYAISENTVKICRVLIGEKEFRGKGIGRQIIRNLVAEAFRNTAIEKIELNVYEWNTAAIQCYLKEGFNILSDCSGVIEINGRIWKSLKMNYLRG